MNSRGGGGGTIARLRSEETCVDLVRLRSEPGKRLTELEREEKGAREGRAKEEEDARQMDAF